MLADDPATWPADLRLSGLTYDHIRAGDRSGIVAERLNWINRDPAGYLPQPYEQLAAWFRRIGHDDRYQRATPYTIWRVFLDATGTLHITPGSLTCALNLRSHHPALIDAGFADVKTPIPWWGGRTLQFTFPPR